MESSPVQNRHAHSKAPSLSECCAVIHVISTIRLSDFLHPFACLFVRRTYGHSYHYSTPSGHVRGGCKTSQFTTHDFPPMLPTRHRGSRDTYPVVYCPRISLRHRTTGSAFPIHTDGAIFRSLSLQPEILQEGQLHTSHHWNARILC
jgi:hypothetical protein